MPERNRTMLAMSLAVPPSATVSTIAAEMLLGSTRCYRDLDRPRAAGPQPDRSPFLVSVGP